MFIGRRPDGTIYGCWSSRQPNDEDHSGIEEVADDHPDLVAFLAPTNQSLVAAIEAERDAALLSGVTWDGKDWHIDQTFQAHITGLVTAFEAGILPAQMTVPIRTRTNTIEQLTFTQLKQLAGAVLMRVQQIWAASWAAKDAL